jgi:hypothetical protein
MTGMISSEGAMRIRRSMLCVLACGALLGLSACNRIADDWKTAQAADTAESYQQFLKQHGDSEFAAKAQERVNQLAEDREWQAASGADTRESYEQFLAQHADSKWASEARTRLDNFQSAATDGAPASAPAVASTGDTAATPAAAPQAAGSKPAVVADAGTAPAQAAAKPAPVLADKTDKADKPLRVASIGKGSHYAQLGAFSSHERAEQEWKTLHGRFGELGSLEPHYTTGKSGSQLVYRLQVGLASDDKVRELCAKLKKRSQGCIAARG